MACKMVYMLTHVLVIHESCTSYMAALGTCIGSFTPPALPYGTMCRTIVGGSPPGLVETLMSNATNSYRLSL